MQVPLPPQANPHADVNQRQVESLGDNALLRNDLSDTIRSAVLWYKVNKTIKENEKQGVTTSVVITDMQKHRNIVNHNGDTVHFAASVNKLPIAWLIVQDLRAGTIQMDDVITWQASDVRAGYGVYDQPGAPTSATVEEVLHDMLNYSGNTAVRALVNYELGGAAAVNNRLAAYPQIPNTRLQPLDANRFYVGNSTSSEAAWILSQLLGTQDSYQQFIKETLSTNIFTDFGVREALAGNDYIVLANKVGILDDPDGNNRHDVGIIYNTRTHKSYSFSFMTTTAYENTDGTNQAEASLTTMGRDTLRFSGDRPVHSAQNAPVVPFSTKQAPNTDGKVLY